MTIAVRVQGLRKTYGGTAVVDGVDLRVGRGEIFGLLGPNGAGKSTTIECILGTRQRDAGDVEVLGLDPGRDRRTLFERVGVQFQEMGYQDKIRVGELCALTSSLYDTSLDWRELLARFGLKDKVSAPVTALSGGQRQRLAIVQALIPDPELVFLDELTTGLDPRARRHVWAIVRGLREDGKTIFLTSHYMDEVETLCDRVAILSHGRIIVEGTPSELVEKASAAGLEEAFLDYVDDALEHEGGSW
ncbi:MAG: type transport system ATP-binding protein [Actinomycetota bacterium]|nr:type transport system ATP-binding protein [Actinomycetota bacterium]